MIKSAVAIQYDDEELTGNIKIILKNVPEITIVDNSNCKKIILGECGKKIRWLSNKILQDFPEERHIGLIFKTSEELILHWLAVLDAGKEPLIMQYPTKKQSMIYWHNSISNTISFTNIQGVICEAEIRTLGLEKLVKTIFFEGEILEADSSCDEIINGTFIQLSSGTTGFRKGMKFTFKELYSYIQSYNEVMDMRETDCIISWLPLYHDMGFIACFTMPIFLGVKLVLIDPIVWVNNRSILFKTIADYNGTLCFMPNFGFEVMSRESLEVPITTMRKWVSGGEPVKKDTMMRFCEHLNTSLESVSVVYGFAETIMAISQSNGIKTCEKDGREVVSCGEIIPGTFIKIIENQIFAKSGYSIQSYLDKISIVDEEGYIPTGDIGFMEKGELYVEGRKHDIMIQAGQKFMLNELDTILAQAAPEWAGRGVCLAKDDEGTGTQTLLILLERTDIIDNEQHKELASRLSQTLPVENFELYFVPDQFLTKTSSGKINRKKTFEDFLKFKNWENLNKSTGVNMHDEIKRHFQGIPFNIPIAEALDSLGLIILDTIVKKGNIKVTNTMTLNEVIKSCVSLDNKQQQRSATEVISLVSFMDFSVLGRFTDADLEFISNQVGMRVEFEHICMPPAPIIANDLIFCDFFLCRDYDERYSYYYDCIQKIKGASLLLMDDHAEFAVGGAGAFPVMDTKFKRGAVSDYIVYRWQNYARNHHLLPVGDVVHGTSLLPAMHLEAIKKISEYLSVPIFRAAVCVKYQQHTADWEYRDYKYDFNIILDKPPGYDNHDKLVKSLCDFIIQNKDRLKRKVASTVNASPIYNDLWHFCAYSVNPIFLEQVINRFNSFIIHGLPCSLHYIQKTLEERGKRFCFAPALNANGGFDASLEQNYECILQTGSWGAPKTSLPVISLMASGGPLTANLPPDFKIDQHFLDYSFIALPEDIKKYLSSK
jgi:non-ribosomal peptide synthetase component E (peptide arylation enzyme)